MKLQILVPQYRETDEIIKPLLDSIALQQSIDLENDIGIIIVNDGSDVKLTDEFLKSYPFNIKYIQNEHKGVSATRNRALDAAKAEYVMFCDADDMFYSMCGLYIVFREMKNDGFDVLVSAFTEETRNPKDKTEIVYINRDMDSTFVHGKIYRRKYLINNNIRWNDELTIHEDSYFNCLAQRLASKDRAKYCSQPFYLWKWRDESICRHDPDYILKTFNNMLDSSTALVKEFLDRSKKNEARFYATAMIYDSYFTLNKDEWINQNNQEYRHNVEIRFKKYWTEFKYLFDQMSKEEKTMVVSNIRQRMYAEGLLMEHIVFDEWIKQIETLEE